MQTFTKAERLSSQVLIDRLVASGKSFNAAPFRITWMMVNEGPAPVQVLISAPKRIFKKAVDRNRIKRLIREAYRKKRSLLTDQLQDKKLMLIIVYTSKTIIEYKEMELKISEVLLRLSSMVKA
jgi:ribonuclease P protein component